MSSIQLGSGGALRAVTAYRMLEAVPPVRAYMWRAYSCHSSSSRKFATSLAGPWATLLQALGNEMRP